MAGQVGEKFIIDLTNIETFWFFFLWLRRQPPHHPHHILITPYPTLRDTLTNIYGSIPSNPPNVRRPPLSRLRHIVLRISPSRTNLLRKESERKETIKISYPENVPHGINPHRRPGVPRRLSPRCRRCLRCLPPSHRSPCRQSRRPAMVRTPDRADVLGWVWPTEAGGRGPDHRHPPRLRQGQFSSLPCRTGQPSAVLLLFCLVAVLHGDAATCNALYHAKTMDQWILPRGGGKGPAAG